MKGLGLAIATLAAAMASGLGGYALGAAQAPSESEAKAMLREARSEAVRLAEASSYRASHAEGVKFGMHEGRVRGRADGASRGSGSGAAAAKAELAVIAEAEAVAADDGLLHLQVTPGSTYTNELPDGHPGYLLPEDQRSLSCVGVHLDGSCVGD